MVFVCKILQRIATGQVVEQDMPMATSSYITGWMVDKVFEIWGLDDYMLALVDERLA